MPVALLSLHLLLPGCTSLKEKRSRIKPVIARLQHEFHVSAAEIDRLDSLHESILACAVVSNDPAHCTRVLQFAAEYCSRHFHEVDVYDQQIEILS